MATLEEINLALQTVNNVVGLRRDLRGNALMAKSDIVRGVKSFQAISDEQNRNADLYKKRVEMQYRIDEDQALARKLSTGLAALGLKKSEVDAELAQFIVVIATLRDAPKTTNQEIVDSSDRVLADVPKFETVYVME